jgi:hypothetical protein
MEYSIDSKYELDSLRVRVSITTLILTVENNPIVE